MWSSTYVLLVRDSMLHDQADDFQLDTDALVASGDCFITLATQLDAITHEKQLPEVIRPQLEKNVRTLLDLQRRYEVRKKTGYYPQT